MSFQVDPIRHGVVLGVPCYVASSPRNIAPPVLSGLLFPPLWSILSPEASLLRLPGLKG